MARRTKLWGALGYGTCYPLAEWPRTFQSITDLGIALPRTYGTWKHANCAGCLKAGKQHWYCVFCLRPDVWEKAKQTETKIGYSIHKGEWLRDLEPLFASMRQAGVVPTEQVGSGAFWAFAKRAVNAQKTGTLVLDMQEAIAA